MVEAMAAVETFRLLAIEGRDGSRMFVAKVPTAASAASTMMLADIDDGAGSGVASLLPPMWWIAIRVPLQDFLHDKYHLIQ